MYHEKTLRLSLECRMEYFLANFYERTCSSGQVGFMVLLVTRRRPGEAGCDRSGGYVRPSYGFRGEISSAAGAEFPDEPGRYHLYVGKARALPSPPHRRRSNPADSARHRPSESPNLRKWPAFSPRFGGSSGRWPAEDGFRAIESPEPLEPLSIALNPP